MVGSGWTFPLSAGVLWLLAGCASMPTSRPVRDLTLEERERLMVRPEDAPPGRDCWASLESPPALAELVDSAALHADIVRQGSDVAESVGPAGQAVLTIQVDSTGDVNWIDVHSSTLAEPTLALVSSFLPERVRTRISEGEDGPHRSGWTFRVGIEIGPALAFKVGRPVFCTPHLRNQAQVKAKLDALFNVQGIDVRGPGQTTLLWILPGEDGRPQRMRVTRSSGNPALDQIAQHAAAEALFDRASADGHPLEDVWVSLPINFASQPRRQRR